MSKTYRLNPSTHQKELESNQIKNKKNGNRHIDADLFEFIREYDAVLMEEEEEKHLEKCYWDEYEAEDAVSDYLDEMDWEYERICSYPCEMCGESWGDDEMNQCDGCMVGAVLNEHGNHVMPDGGFMGCTKDRYE